MWVGAWMDALREDGEFRKAYDAVSITVFIRQFERSMIGGPAFLLSPNWLDRS